MGKSLNGIFLVCMIGIVSALGGCMAMCMLPGMMGEMHGKGDRGHHEENGKVGNMVICPVDGMRFQVTSQTPTFSFQGKIYYFCSESDRKKFEENPENFIDSKSHEHP